MGLGKGALLGWSASRCRSLFCWYCSGARYDERRTIILIIFVIALLGGFSGMAVVRSMARLRWWRRSWSCNRHSFETGRDGSRRYTARHALGPGSQKVGPRCAAHYPQHVGNDAAFPKALIASNDNVARRMPAERLESYA